MVFHAIQWRERVFESQSWSPGRPLPEWWPSGTHRAEPSREPACQSPWAGGAPSPAQVRTRRDRRTCCRGSLRWEEAVSSARRSRQLFILVFLNDSKHCPMWNGKIATGNGQLPPGFALPGMAKSHSGTSCSATGRRDIQSVFGPSWSRSSSSMFFKVATASLLASLPHSHFRVYCLLTALPARTFGIKAHKWRGNSGELQHQNCCSQICWGNKQNSSHQCLLNVVVRFCILKKICVLAFLSKVLNKLLLPYFHVITNPVTLQIITLRCIKTICFEVLNI